ncbi:MAG: HD domain-containing protein [Candidatus Paceibacterota bacterium]
MRSLLATGEEVRGVLVAHSGEWNAFNHKIKSPENRYEREERESLYLSDGATLSINSKGRVFPEEEDRNRTCFEVDRDRILRSATFRRMAGKCQVFINPADDMLRTRLTHTLEVEQIASSISNALGLNTNLARAIALAHDCGHGPGGHTSEEAFTPFLSNGFDHATWGADHALTDLNLTYETLDGVRNHSWRLSPPSTPEASVVSWADRIAYVTHDWADAVRIGMVKENDLPKYISTTVSKNQDTQVQFFIKKLVICSRYSGAVSMDLDSAKLLNEFRNHNFNVIYSDRNTAQSNEKFKKMLVSLVDFYIESDTNINKHESALSAVKYVASMTDRYSIKVAERELGYKWYD